MATTPSDFNAPTNKPKSDGPDPKPEQGAAFKPAEAPAGGDGGSKAGDNAGPGASKTQDIPSVATAATQLFKDGAAKIGKEATDRARGYLDDGKAQAGGVLDELARMMSEAAGTVDEKLGEQYGHYARSAAEKVTDFSEGLKAKQLDDLIEDARGFAQKSPAIAIGTAAALGFVLVRLIQAGLAPPEHKDA